jgi:predicted ABC-type ATPase
MYNLFFNTEIISDHDSHLESFANSCFYSIRYLFQGRTIEILDGKVENEYLSCPQWNWKKTAFAIIALIPGILLGLPAKFLSYYCYASARENYQIAQSYQSASSPIIEKEESPVDKNEGEDQIEKDSLLSDLFNLSNIYSSNPQKFSYSLPRSILESFLSGKAFDHKKEYTSEELELLKKDIIAIYQAMLNENPIKQPLAIMTAGAPGSGKTTLLKQNRQTQLKKGKAIAYICPDDICLQQMAKTYQQEIKEKMASPSLTEDEQKELRLECYNKWRPGSNAGTHLILANLIRHQYAFYFGTTSTGPATGKFLEFLKAKGYTIKLLHITAPDDVRWASIQERDKTFVQTTEQDIRDKGDLLPQRIMDAFLQFADEIEFFYRDALKEDAVLAARWQLNEPPAYTLGTLQVIDTECYEQIKKVHNAVCDKLKKPDLVWEETVEKHSVIL